MRTRPEFDETETAERIWFEPTPDGMVGHVLSDDLVYSCLWRMSYREAVWAVKNDKFPLAVGQPFHLPRRIKTVQTDNGRSYPLHECKPAGPTTRITLSKPTATELAEVANRKHFASTMKVLGLPTNVSPPHFAERETAFEYRRDYLAAMGADN